MIPDDTGVFEWEFSAPVSQQLRALFMISMT